METPKKRKHFTGQQRDGSASLCSLVLTILFHTPRPYGFLDFPAISGLSLSLQKHLEEYYSWSRKHLQELKNGFTPDLELK